jgi:LysM repeat protein
MATWERFEASPIEEPLLEADEAPPPDRRRNGSVLANGNHPEVHRPSGATAVVITGEDWLAVICPYLRAGDGSWRSAVPNRDHRCWATDPPSELPVLTQQRLCLAREHDGCERFVHARELRTSSFARARPPTPEPPLQADVVVSEPVPLGPVARLGATPRRTMIAAGAGGALALALLAVAVAAPRQAGSAPSPTPSSSTAAATPGATRPPRSPRAPATDRRYRVKPGDTLRSIADQFGVTVREIRAVNELGTPPTIEPGQVLVIPRVD